MQRVWGAAVCGLRGWERWVNEADWGGFGCLAGVFLASFFGLYARRDEGALRFGGESGDGLARFLRFVGVASFVAG